MKRSIKQSIRASDYPTIAQYRMAAIQEEGINYSLLERLLTKFFGVPKSALNRWAYGKEASFEHLHILSRVEQLSKNTPTQKLRDSIEEMIRKETRGRGQYLTTDTAAISEPCSEHLMEHVSAHYESRMSPDLQNYADKHGV